MTESGKLGSLFDGAGTFPFAALQFGIEPSWASEIESFPVSVTKKRFPNMVHLGDITKINGSEISPVDVITFGSPCQDLSVAGKQAGLAGERSGLFMEAVRIIKEMRGATNGKYPRYAVWENVPGAFSSNNREDFRVVLEELCKIKDESAHVPRPSGKGKWGNAGLILGTGYSVAWRVLDAQFWGVPQRRRRIFLVADFRGRSAGEILFEREGLSRSFAESRKAWKGLTADTTFGSYQAGKCFDARGNGNGNISPTITGKHNNSVTDYTSVVVFTKGTKPHNSEEAQKWNPSDKANCLNTFDTGEQRASDLVVLGVDTYNQDITGDKTKSLLAGHMDCDGVPCEAIKLTQDPVPNERVFSCLSTGNPIAGQANLAICCTLDSLSSNSMKSHIRQVLSVRRVVPIECARLQGMPDWWCKDIPHSDSAEYKMWGNGMALPCAMYVMEGIAKELLKAEKEEYENINEIQLKFSF